jgi:hypothetical protein
VQGEGAFGRADWGLDNTSGVHEPREHATLRLQAWLGQRHGLRDVLAPTTDYRAFWDALPDDPLAPRHDPTVALAVRGARRAAQAPWAPHLEIALSATAATLRIVLAASSAVTGAAARGEGGSAATGEPDGRGALAATWRDVVTEQPPHPTGLPAGTSGTCGDCAWRMESGTRRRVSRCRQANDARVEADWPGCERWEPELDCQTCGACCRAAYDLVITSLRDPVVRLHPELVVLREDHAQVLRAGDQCAALSGGPDGETLEGFAPWSCTIYGERPKPCREFEKQSLHCLIARRRTGMSL